MQIYKGYFKKSFSESLQYRADFWLSLLSGWLIMYVLISLWTSLYEATSIVQENSLGYMITYAVIVTLLNVVLRSNIEFEIEDKIRSGDIAAELLRPVDYQKVIVASTMGKLIANILTKGIPLFLLGVFSFEVIVPSGLYLIEFVISVFLGSLLFCGLSFCIGILCVWTSFIWSYVMMVRVLIIFLSGMIVPLWLYPQWLQTIADFLPFKALFFLPASIYLERLGHIEVFWVFMTQLAWIGILFGLGRVIWIFAQRKVTIYGG